MNHHYSANQYQPYAALKPIDNTQPQPNLLQQQYYQNPHQHHPQSHPIIYKQSPLPEHNQKLEPQLKQSIYQQTRYTTPNPQQRVHSQQVTPQMVTHQNKENGRVESGVEPIEIKYNRLVQNLSVFNLRPNEQQETQKPHQLLSDHGTSHFESVVETDPRPSMGDTTAQVYQMKVQSKEWQMIRQELSLKEGEVIKLQHMLHAKQEENNQLQQHLNQNVVKANHALEQQLARELNEKENIINDLSVSLCNAKNQLAQVVFENQELKKCPQQFNQVQQLMQEQVLLKAENERLQRVLQEQQQWYEERQHPQHKDESLITTLKTEIHYLKHDLMSQQSAESMLIQDLREQVYFYKHENRRLNDVIMNRCQY